MKKVCVVLLLIFCFILNAQNEINTLPIIPAFTLCPQAQITGLGEIGVVAPSSDYFTGTFKNPALLNSDEKINGISASIKEIPPGWFFYNVVLLYSSLDRISIGYSFSQENLGNGYYLDSDSNNIFYKTNYNIHALRFSYSLNPKFNIGFGIKYYQITNTIAKKGGIGSDIGFRYSNNIINNDKYKIQYDLGFDIVNMGPKIAFCDDCSKDFLPTELNIGGMIALYREYDKINYTFNVLYQADKFLIPTPPIYYSENSESIIKGRDPERSALNAIFTSFYDAPGGFSEEIREIIHHFGSQLDVNFDQKIKCSLQYGYFLESETKGNRKFHTIGMGAEYQGFMIYYSHILSKNDLLHNFNNISLGYVLKM